MYVSIGWSALCHLESGDPKRPDVSETVIADLLDDLWGHPEWSPDDRVSLGHRILATQSGERSLQGQLEHEINLKCWIATKHSNKPWKNCVSSPDFNKLTVSCPATPKSAVRERGGGKDGRWKRTNSSCNWGGLPLTEFGLSVQVEKNVPCLYVSVYLSLEMEVLESFQSIVQYHRYFFFL